ncbi:MAG: tol-pal system YbgF family protein [Candidatus Methylacidiphilales bacterium]
MPVVFFILTWNCCFAQTQQAPEKMADIYYKASDYSKALPLYFLLLKEANLDESERARISFFIGQCQTAQHQYNDALKSFDDVATRYGNTEWAPNALLRKGAVELGVLNKPKEGLVTWQVLAKRYSKAEATAEALFYRCTYFLLNKQRTQAKEALHVLELDFPNNPLTLKAQNYFNAKL